MASKSGHLRFGGRAEYAVYSVASPVVSGVVKYYAMCPCDLGRHYLGYDDAGNLIECTEQNGHLPFRFQTYADAQAAIETWQRQHQPESEE